MCVLTPRVQDVKKQLKHPKVLNLTCISSASNGLESTLAGFRKNLETVCCGDLTSMALEQHPGRREVQHSTLAFLWRLSKRQQLHRHTSADPHALTAMGICPMWIEYQKFGYRADTLRWRRSTQPCSSVTLPSLAQALCLIPCFRDHAAPQDSLTAALAVLKSAQ